jgi:release factor H-coupled RctB family protein
VNGVNRVSDYCGNERRSRRNANRFVASHTADPSASRAKAVLKMNVTDTGPSPVLTDTLSPSDGERAGVRGSLWLHRKGAVCAENDFVVIPGSRGTLSYLVKPTGDGESHAWSLAHGAGRKWARSDARLRTRERFSVGELVQTGVGGRVICEERDLLYEEAPAAYKNIEAVIQDLADAGLVSVIATFRPLLTYKTRKLRR